MKITPAPNEPGTTEPRLYRVVAARIEELIRAENIRGGERLPAERELAAKLGVSRTSLREGLIALELGGKVEVRGGSGVYVSEQAAPQAVVPTAGPGPFEVLAARRMIEVEVAALAAKHANDSAIDAILLAVEEMEQHHEDRSANEMADRNFHLAIARATGNSAMVGVIEYLWSQRGSLWHKLKEHFQTEELRQQTLIDHRNIFAAIASHDVAGARQAMRAHLDRVTRTFSRG
ncbi:FadR/GntR family transcriptional regulator [Massilia aurea]|jgi:DNA-binding FadR family transcriptional regulator|uniref:DNA-binding FadR family transcriptional regulator n=1 Tax=Massilia aurea TaxID=373040 RepID=A0A7X0CD73_9BURK|nr:FadR/GntR family transcriptional regulator [Massilia aurea]MBD8563108.1 FadR family transcriptional regulator [Oxalobacteraceae sp. CFBP 8763]MBD8655799.1 FadR family transcriptional regulator [Oxalobacteraceae sp. CFBP 13730]RYE87862.1 MAG: FadR family transcriptional regulator [Oxalobacteraceae bacterium]MBB6133361.1 DNA-binding FadR family transcriptional regulator [Massilia aurea]MCS0705717.1 FadR family transcriptional regulator [Massilia aurea]